MSRRRLSGQVVLVTGAARGIGEHTARLAAAQGARLALAGLEPQRLEALAAGLNATAPGSAVWFECDVTDSAALRRAVEGTVAAFGGIDIVMANAGVASLGTVATAEIDALARTVEVNLIGVMRTAHATLPELIRSRGYLLLVSSTASFAVLPGMSAYCASKAGCEHFGHALRLEVAHLGVRVGTAHPAWVDTDLVRDAQHDLPSFRAALRSLPWPLRAVTGVDDCARALVQAMLRRSRRVYVPRAVALVQAARTVIASPLSERVLRRSTARQVPRMEAEARALSRSFGEHSVGLGGGSALPGGATDAAVPPARCAGGTVNLAQLRAQAAPLTVIAVGRALVASPAREETRSWRSLRGPPSRSSSR